MSTTAFVRFSTFRLLLSVCFLLFFSGCSPKNTDSDALKKRRPLLPVVTITPSDARVATEYSAMLEGKGNVDIRPQVDGTLSAILVDEGAFVKAGQTLFKIDDRLYREQYNGALALQQAAEASLVVAKLNEEKLVPLVQNNVVADIQLKTAKANTQLALATVEQSRASVRSAKVNLDYTLIKSPMSGYIGKILFRAGSLLSKNQSSGLTILSDVSSIYANFSISEVAFMQFRQQYAGSTVQEKIQKLSPVSLVMADGSLYPEKGSIGTVSGQFDQATGSVRVRALFPNSKALLRAGSTGKVIMESIYHDVLLVPQSATVELQDKVFVFLLMSDNRVKKQVITIAGKSSNNYIVSFGLKPGDTIVTTGIEKLQEGAVIKPVNNPQPVTAGKT